MTNEVSRAEFADGESFRLRFDELGLIPVVAQDVTTGEVLLLAFMNADALGATLATGALTLWSRSRRALWRKGETSGHTLQVVELRVNCEANSLLARVKLDGPGACHEGYRGCYYRALTTDSAGARADNLTARVVELRAFDPATVYPVERSDENDADTALERDARILYAAYERLRDIPPSQVSRTATLLRAADIQQTSQHALARARQELDELRGAADGTHQHYGDERDIILEASQVGYWTTVAAVALRLPYDAWRPHAGWLAGWRDGHAGRQLESEAESETARALVGILESAGAVCRSAGIHPGRALAADLAEMRQKYDGV